MKVLIVDERYNESKTFVGYAGIEFAKMLMEAGILSSRCTLTGIIPDTGDPIDHQLQPTKAKGLKFRDLYTSAGLKAGIEKLHTTITNFDPDLIIGLGNWPLWALTAKAKVATKSGYKLPTGAMNWRGSQIQTEPINGKCFNYLCVLSPSLVLRDWSLRPITVHDLRARAARFIAAKTTWEAAKTSTTVSQPNPNQVWLGLQAWLKQLRYGPLELSIDLETYNRQSIACIGICDDTTELCIPFFYFDAAGTMLNYFTEQEELETFKLLRELFRSPNLRCIGQNFMYDYQWLRKFFLCELPVSFDTMIAHHLLYPGTPKSLDRLASLYCDHYIYWKDESEDWSSGSHEDLWLYNCKDVRYTYEIAQELKPLLEQAKLTEQFAFRLQEWKLAAAMMDVGTLCDVGARAEFRAELYKAQVKLEAYLLRCVPEDLRITTGGGNWFGSPLKTAEIFYTHLGFKPVLHKKTKQPTTDAQALDTLGKQNPKFKPLFSRLDMLRSIKVFISHFLDAGIGYDNRIRCNYNISGTETFRWSSSANAFGEGTNLQNIPKGD